MKTFLIFSFIALMRSTLAHITRDVSQSYQYYPGYSSGAFGAAGGFLHALGSSPYSSPIASGNTNFYSAPLFGTAGTSGFVPSTNSVLLRSGGNGLGNIGSSAGFSYASSQNNYNDQSEYTQNVQNQTPIITKHFYMHSAPEDHDEQQIVRYVNIGRPQKNYRVVFINAPTSNVSKAKIIANVAPVEDKTDIYVLAKKLNALDVSAEVVTQRPVHNKPQVHFIKYKTQAEAERVQQAIQAQYNGLGGSSEVSNEGVIPVSSVIGNLGGGEGSAGNVNPISSGSGGSSAVSGSIIGQATGGDNTHAKYLPANHK